MKIGTCIFAISGALLLSGCAARLPEDELRSTRERLGHYLIREVMTQSEMNIVSCYLAELAKMERYMIEYRIWNQPGYDNIEKSFMEDCEAWERRAEVEARKPSEFKGGSLAPCDLNLRREHLEQKRIDELKTKWRKP